ncbi:hypothetical protein Tco_1441108, partial [Tanacetum coccineum]
RRSRQQWMVVVSKVDLRLTMSVPVVVFAMATVVVDPVIFIVVVHNVFSGCGGGSDGCNGDFRHRDDDGGGDCGVSR